MPDIPNILEESLLESIIKESPMIASFLTTGSDCGDEINMERGQGRAMPYVEKMMTTSLETELKEKMKRLIFKKKLLAKELQEHKKEIAALREMIINMKLSEDHDFEALPRLIVSVVLVVFVLNYLFLQKSTRDSSLSVFKTRSFFNKGLKKSRSKHSRDATPKQFCLVEVSTVF